MYILSYFIYTAVWKQYSYVECFPRNIQKYVTFVSCT